MSTGSMAGSEDELVRFVIMGVPRTGSTRLVDLLTQHPAVVANGEVLNPAQQEYTWAHRRGLSSSELIRLGFGHPGPRNAHKHQCRAIGFKILDEQLTGSANEVTKILAADPAIRIVNPTRNPLESLRSLVQARATGHWQRTATADDDPPRVRISVAACEDFFRRCARLQELIEVRFSTHPRLTIDYSTVLIDPAATLFRLHDLLDVPRVPLRQETYLKQEHRRLAETVLDFADLRWAFRGRPEARFFNCEEPAGPVGR